jgi:L-threonylcarbamoyladenylate synthase
MPVLLRPGGVAAGQIEGVLGEPLQMPDSAAPRASGTLAAHYAPNTSVELLPASALIDRVAALAARGLRVAAWSRERPGRGEAHWEPTDSDPDLLAQRLYDTLRRLDRAGYDRLLIERPPEPGDSAGDWAAVIDRLRRAAAGAAADDAENRGASGT